MWESTLVFAADACPASMARADSNFTLDSFAMPRATVSFKHEEQAGLSNRAVEWSNCQTVH